MVAECKVSMSSVESLDVVSVAPPPKCIVVRDVRVPEYIFGHRVDPETGQREYLVKFRDLSTSLALWMDPAALDDAGLVSDFEARLRAAQPRRKIPRRCVHIGLESYRKFIGVVRRPRRGRPLPRFIDLTKP